MSPSGGAYAQYEQSVRFNSAAPLPKSRKRSDPKPGARKAPATVLFIVEDPARGLALIRGKNVKRVLEAAVVLERARWSPGSKGYVVAMSDMPDIAAMAGYLSIPYRITATVEGAG